MLKKFTRFMNEEFDSDEEDYTYSSESDVEYEFENQTDKVVGGKMVNIYKPVTASTVDKILKKIKNKELCIVNYKDMDKNERSSIEEQIKGALFALDGTYVTTGEDIGICLSVEYMVEQYNNG